MLIYVKVCITLELSRLPVCFLVIITDFALCFFMVLDLRLKIFGCRETSDFFCHEIGVSYLS